MTLHFDRNAYNRPTLYCALTVGLASVRFVKNEVGVLSAQRAESGGEVLWEVQQSPTPPARGSGECCKVPQWGQCEVQAANSF